MIKKLLAANLILLLCVTYTVNAQYISSTTEQVSAPYVNQGSVNNPIIRLRIDVGTTPIPIDGIVMDHNGSTNPAADIQAAKIYYTTDTIFSTLQQYGSTWTIFPAIDMAFSSSLQSAPGTNYFWLTYDIKQSAVCNDYVDAACVLFDINGLSIAPAITSPPGASIICGTTGITKPEFSGSDLYISPNPATDKIYISFPATSENFTVKIYSVTGEVVFAEENKVKKFQTLNYNYQTSIDVTGLSNGIYFLSVQTGREKITRKIVVNH